MTPFRGHDERNMERVEVPPKRRAWALVLVVPFFASLAFMTAETRTLQPAAGNVPTSTEGFDAPRMDVHVDERVVVLRFVLAALALYGVVLFATRPRGTTIHVQRGSRS